MKRPWLTVVVVLLLVLLGSVWFVNTYERRMVSEFHPPAEEARLNRLLAARRLLEHLGLHVLELNGLEGELHLPPRSALLVPARRGAISPAALDRVEAFVRGGGHLIVESESLQVADPLLKRLGIRRVALDPSGPGYFGWRGPRRPGSRRVESYGLLNTADQLGEPPLTLSLSSRHGLRAMESPLWWLAAGDANATDNGDDSKRVKMEKQRNLPLHDAKKRAGLPARSQDRGTRADDPAHIVHLALGDGRVTALTNFVPFMNWDIGTHDHAELLHRLVLAGGNTDTLAMVRGRRTSLGTWLLEHAWRVLLAFGLLILALLWAAAPRFGPVLPDPQPVRRRLLDHIAASGRLLWSSGERATLARAAIAGAMARVHADHP
ncbi:MAG TPA: DUF4350 domain-containing protein, partial [Xanthomonadaceae bacterium]|nr:DUF4350 domain-containing protein [Xanthomonadaceae bacterium]